jgi:hypothetical protein
MQIKVHFCWRLACLTEHWAAYDAVALTMHELSRAF